MLRAVSSEPVWLRARFRDPELAPASDQVNVDVVLPDETRQQLFEALTQIEKHRLIFTSWGLGERHPTGVGLVFNFAGPPGTGKTICAEAGKPLSKQRQPPSRQPHRDGRNRPKQQTALRSWGLQRPAHHAHQRQRAEDEEQNTCE